MTRKDIGRIGAALGLALGMVGCSRLDGQTPAMTAGKLKCSWTSVSGGKRFLVCPSYTVIDPDQRTATVCGDTSGIGVGRLCH